MTCSHNYKGSLASDQILMNSTKYSKSLSIELPYLWIRRDIEVIYGWQVPIQEFNILPIWVFTRGLVTYVIGVNFPRV